MTYADAQIEIALLASIERQADRTAAALERVRRNLGLLRSGRAACQAKRREKKNHA